MRYKDLLSTNDILQLLKNSLNLETKQTGKNIFLLCPFHPDNNPSMSFEPNRKIFSCWSCHFKAYDFFDFWARYQKITKEQALREISQKGFFDLQQANLEEKKEIIRSKKSNSLNLSKLIYQHNLFTKEGRSALQYLIKRQVSWEAIERFMLGAAINHKQLSNLLFTNPPATIEADFLLSSNLLKVNSQEEKTHDFFYQQLIIPLSNSEGEIVSFAGRKLNSSNSESKYIYLPNHDGYQKSGLLYNYYYVKSSEEKECYLVEGFFDVISLTMAGVSNSLALLGTSLTEEQTKLLSNLKKRIVLFLDGDRAGHEATVTITKKLLSREIDCEIVATDYQSDPDEIFRSQGVTAVNSLIKTRENPYKFIINYYYNHLEINHNPQRITLFIEEMAKIFAKFKLSSQNFVIEIISELTGWKRNEVESKFVKFDFPVLADSEVIIARGKTFIRQWEKEIVALCAKSRTNWIYLLTKRRFLPQDPSYRKVANYYEKSLGKNSFLGIKDQKINYFLFNKSENKIIDSLLSKINLIRKFHEIVLNE